MHFLSFLYKISSKAGYYSFPNSVFLKLYDYFLKIKNAKRFQNARNTFIITGIPRSGTTWMAELLSNNKVLYIEEPLKLGTLKETKYLNFSWRQYIPENDSWEGAKTFFDKLLTGRIIKPVLIERNRNIPLLYKADKILIKFVRLNQLLPWVVNNFSVPRPLYLLRHPCATIYSEMNHGAWNYTKSLTFPYHYKAPDTPFGNYYKRFENLLPPIQTIEEHLAVDWCLDTYPIHHPWNNKEWITISYEEAFLHPEVTLTHIKNSTKWYIAQETFNKIKIPSTSTQQNNPLFNDRKQLDKWKDKLTKDQIRRIFNILECFGINFYDDQQSEPDYDKIKSWNKNKLFYDY